MAPLARSAGTHGAVSAETPAGTLDSVLHENTDLVRRIAHHLVRRLPSHVDVRDLIQAGYLGLLDAAGNFAASHNTSFATYARIRIRGAMFDFLRLGASAPRPLFRRLREISAASWDIQCKTGKAPSSAEVAAELGVSLEDYHRTLQDADVCRTQSLQQGQTTDGYCLSDTVPDECADIIADLERQQARDALAAAIDELPERERTVILLYYREDLCLREIGEQLHVSESRVSQIRAIAVDRLRMMAQRWISDELRADDGAQEPAADATGDPNGDGSLLELRARTDSNRRPSGSKPDALSD